MQPAAQISICVRVSAASEAKSICPNENLVGKGLFKALLDTSSKGCAEQLLTRITGFLLLLGSCSLAEDPTRGRVLLGSPCV